MAISSPQLLLIFFFFSFYIVQLHALNIGLQVNVGLGLFKECSKTCESMFCEAPPFLRYGKYCGLLYTGCPGEQPCDRLDTCCMHHDQCILNMGNDYLSQKCNKEFLKCVDSFKKSRAPTFKGNTCEIGDVIQAINNAMKAAIVAGRIFDELKERFGVKRKWQTLGSCAVILYVINFFSS